MDVVGLREDSFGGLNTTVLQGLRARFGGHLSFLISVMKSFVCVREILDVVYMKVHHHPGSQGSPATNAMR